MSVIRWWRGLDNGTKQLIFVLGILLGGFELVLLLSWLAAGDPDAGIAFLIINGTIAVCVAVILLARKLFPENK